MSNCTSAFKRKDQISSEISSKTGEPTQAEHPSFIQGNRNEIKRIKTKFYLLLLLSNLLIISIYQFAPDETVEELVSVDLINHEGFTKMKIALKAFLEFPKGVSEIPISLYSDDGQLIITKAFIHPNEERNLRESDNLNFEENEVIQIEVEVPDEEIKKIILQNRSYFKAYPYQEKSIIQKKQRRSAHEIRI